MQSILAVAVLSAIFLPAADTFSPDTDGFIRNWLVLAPIPLPEDSGASEIDKDLIKGEAAVMPKAGDKVAIGGAELVWQPQQASDYFLDFVTAYGTVRGEDAAAYAVAYVMADEEMKVTLSVGSNDQCKAWLNGKQVVRFAEQDWTVVGHFAAGGSSFESEIWGENEQFMPVFRGEIFQSLTFRMKDPSAFEGLKTTLEADARLVVDAVQEHDFYAKQSTMLATILNFIAIFIASIMGVGAVFGAINTMYSSPSYSMVA